MKFVSSFVSISTTLPPQYFTSSGYVTQYGAGIITSSPLSMVALKRLKSECLAPLFTMIWSSAYSKLLSLFSLSATACFSAGIPSTAVYLVKSSFIAFIAASFITCGVEKSGSPAEKLHISLPCAFNSCALVGMAIVIDSDSVFMRFVSMKTLLKKFHNYTKKMLSFS